MNGLFTENKYYIEYETHLIHLNELMAKGLENTEDVEAIRDAMDTPWYHLTEEETNRLRGLSADLYMLQDDEVFQPSDGRSKIQTGQAAYAAMDQERWDEALMLMRQPNLIPRAQIAAMRASAYEGLGHLEAALLFLRYAIELDPNHPVPRSVELNLLVNGGREEEARQKAQAYLNDTSVPAFLRINAAGIIAQTSEHAKNFWCESLVPALERALQTETPTTPLRRDVMAFGYEVLAYCYFRLGDVQQAYDAVTRGMRLSPSVSLAFMQEGFKQILSGDTEASSKYEQSMPRKLQSPLRSLRSNTYAAAA